MASSNTPLNYPSDRDRTTHVAGDNYADRVLWGPIVAGLVVALSTQLVLSALGAAVGLSSIGGSEAPRSEAAGVGIGIGIWAIVSLLVSLFVGGWMAARASGRINRNTALLNGAILWASVLTLSAWLLSSGVTGAFGLAASTASNLIDQAPQSITNAIPGAIPGNTAPGTVPDNVPNITAEQTRDLAGNAAKVSSTFVLGSLLGLGAALIGSVAGHRRPKAGYADRY